MFGLTALTTDLRMRHRVVLGVAWIPATSKICLLVETGCLATSLLLVNSCRHGLFGSHLCRFFFVPRWCGSESLDSPGVTAKFF